MPRGSKKGVSSTKASDSTNSNTNSVASSSSSVEVLSHFDLCPCQQPSAPCSKETRNTKQSKEDTDTWISCDYCDQWWHASCAGLNDNTVHFIVCSKSTYKCPTCCIGLIPAAPQKRNKSKLRLQTKDSKECTNNSKGTEEPPIKHTNVIACDQSSTVAVDTQCSEKVVGPAIQLLAGNPGSKLLDHTSPQKKTVTWADQVEVPIATNNQDKSSNKEEQSERKTTCEETIHFSDDTATNQSNTILIIDGINEPQKYLSRRCILQEVNKYKPRLGIKFAYPLPGGGICLHLRNSSDLEEALSDWPEGAFGSHKIKPHLPTRAQTDTTCFTHLPVSINTAVLTSKIASEIGISCTARRLKETYSKTELTAVEILTNNSSDNNKLIGSAVYIGNFKASFHPRKSIKVIRCYRCQQFGHIEKTCKNNCVCVRCGKNHQLQGKAKCNEAINCVNCLGDHPANSTVCPEYKTLVQKLTSRLI